MILWLNLINIYYLFVSDIEMSYDMEEHGKRGDPICVRTRSNHCSGPFKCSSIQQGVDVTV